MLCLCRTFHILYKHKCSYSNDYSSVHRWNVPITSTMLLSTDRCTDGIFQSHLRCCCLQVGAPTECSCHNNDVAVYTLVHRRNVLVTSTMLLLSTAQCTDGIFQSRPRCCCIQFCALMECSCHVYNSVHCQNVPVISTVLLSTVQCTNEMFLSHLRCCCLQFGALSKCSGYLYGVAVYGSVH